MKGNGIAEIEIIAIKKRESEKGDTEKRDWKGKTAKKRLKKVILKLENKIIDWKRTE